MTDTFARIKEKKEELQRIMKEEGEAALKDAFKEIFADGSVKKIYWRQYTPYFNDGDACVFSYHEMQVDFGPEVGGSYSDYDEDDPWTWWEAWSLRHELRENTGEVDPKLVSVPIETLGKVIELDATLSENEDLLLSVFGDHVEVRVTPTEITSEFYSHD